MVSHIIERTQGDDTRVEETSKTLQKMNNHNFYKVTGRAYFDSTKMFETMILFANIRLEFQLQCISNSTCTAKQRYYKRSAKIIIEMKMIEFKSKKEPLLGRLPHFSNIGICQALESPFAQDSTCCCNRDMV